MIFEDMDRIVFAGDSVTDMGSPTPVSEGPWDNNLGDGYVRQVYALLGACYPEIRLRITNSGVSGNTSRDLLERFDRDVLSLNANWVSIMIGINDVWRFYDTPGMADIQVSEEEYGNNLTKMITDLKKQPQLKGIFVMSPVFMDINLEDIMRRKHESYRQVCEKVAKENDTIYIDVQSEINEYLKTRPATFIAPDRVHPNPVGNVLIARAFLDAAGFDYEHRCREING